MTYSPLEPRPINDDYETEETRAAYQAGQLWAEYGASVHQLLQLAEHWPELDLAGDIVYESELVAFMLQYIVGSKSAAYDFIEDQILANSFDTVDYDYIESGIVISFILGVLDRLDGLSSEFAVNIRRFAEA